MIPDPRRIPAVAADAANALWVLARSGLADPFVPRREQLALLAHAPFKTPNLGTAVQAHAALRPGATALIDDEGAVTWRELADRTQRLANALLEVAQPGSAVAFMLRNSRENVECYAACGLAGMTAVPVNTWSSADEVDHIVDTQDAALLISSDEFSESTRNVAIPMWLTGEGGSYESALAGASPAVPRGRGGGRIVTHTSGTTGKPKGAERSVGAASVDVLVAFLEKVPLRRRDTFFLVPPLFHQFAQAMMAVGLVLGCTMVMTRRFDAEQFLELSTEHGVTVAALLPVMLKRIAAVEGGPTPPLRLAVVSGSALPPAVREAAEERLGEIFYDLYGSTEVGWATIATPQDHRHRPGTVGRAGRGSRIVIADEEGRPLPAGETGRIFVASAFAFEGYTGVEADQEVIEDALAIGDLGYLDEDGYLFVTGRVDDMIVSGGENIFPSEVEGVLERRADLVESAVVGVEDDEYGQVLHAFVVPRDGADVTADGITDFVKQHLSRYKAPKRVTLLDELPRNAAGKVLKRELREAGQSDVR